MSGDRSRTVFFCRDCGNESLKWMGFCPACGSKNPLSEAPRAGPTSTPRRRAFHQPAELEELSGIEPNRYPRISVGIGELDRVLGGGIVPGSAALMAGEPGVGKSTLLLQTAGLAAGRGLKVVYVSGEESAQQIKVRSDRLGIQGTDVFLLSETDVDQIIERLDRSEASLVIVDSIQTLHAGDVQSGPGSVAQVRECALRLIRWCKDMTVPLIMSGHVTKDGALAGPRALEHMVDVSLHMEGENATSYRILRGTKNRFGSTDEVGIFKMAGAGLVEVDDPSRVMLAHRQHGSIGSAIAPVIEGSRPLLVEIQSLTSPSILPAPRRVTNGTDYNRLLMLSAVLSRRVGLSLAGQDIIVNVAGGLRIREPGADLATALSIASSCLNSPLPEDMAAIGEVGLTGELRPAPQLERRLGEAARLGFRKAIVPPAGAGDGRMPAPEGIELAIVPTLAAAVRQSLGVAA